MQTHACQVSQQPARGHPGRTASGLRSPVSCGLGPRPVGPRPRHLSPVTPPGLVGSAQKPARVCESAEGDPCRETAACLVPNAVTRLPNTQGAPPCPSRHARIDPGSSSRCRGHAGAHDVGSAAASAGGAQLAACCVDTGSVSQADAGSDRDTSACFPPRRLVGVTPRPPTTSSPRSTEPDAGCERPRGWDAGPNGPCRLLPCTGSGAPPFHVNPQTSLGLLLQGPGPRARLRVRTWP